MKENCLNCQMNKTLILWRYFSDGRYLPDYDNPLQCCTLFVDDKDDPTVFGHTVVPHEGMCECFTPVSIFDIKSR